MSRVDPAGNVLANGTDEARRLTTVAAFCAEKRLGIPVAIKVIVARSTNNRAAVAGSAHAAD